MSDMNVREAYNLWAEQYDSNQNKTRDLEAKSLRETLSPIEFETCLEIGCGTGKNTGWLLTKSKHITAIDISDEMLIKAKENIIAENVSFHQADIKKEWDFGNRQFDLITFSLVLEHIENLDEVFRKAADLIKPDGYVYIGELHPFKQYLGTKARFETEDGLQIVECFNHHISDFTQSAKKNCFDIINVKEYFDGNDPMEIPRILTMLFRKRNN